jgi:hypothetical protein
MPYPGFNPRLTDMALVKPLPKGGGGLFQASGSWGWGEGEGGAVIDNLYL